MKTYLSKEGKIIVPQCGNCNFFECISEPDRIGYCKLRPLTFAYTGKQTVLAMVRTFYICNDHLFINEDLLRENNTQVEMKFEPKNKQVDNGTTAAG